MYTLLGILYIVYCIVYCILLRLLVARWPDRSDSRVHHGPDPSHTASTIASSSAACNLTYHMYLFLDDPTTDPSQCFKVSVIVQDEDKTTLVSEPRACWKETKYYRKTKCMHSCNPAYKAIIVYTVRDGPCHSNNCRSRSQVPFLR